MLTKQKAAIAGNFNNLPSNLREELLLKLADNNSALFLAEDDYALFDSGSMLRDNFDKLSKPKRHCFSS